jgi:threonine/homoserine/homoserine lactone efflux protein
MVSILWLGFLLGVGAALSVGPIFVTIIQEAATRGFDSSFRIIIGSAVADLILLVPALAFTWIIQRVADASFWVSIIGICFFLYLAIEALRDSYRIWTAKHQPAPHNNWSFFKGLFANLANPLTWTFWLAMGTPTMLHTYQQGGWFGLLLFTVTWFVVASGLEAIIAFVIARSRILIGIHGQAVFSGVSSLVFFVLAASMLHMVVLHP